MKYALRSGYRTAHAHRSASYRPRLHFLEARLPLGDALLGPLLGAVLLEPGPSSLDLAWDPADCAAWLPAPPEHGNAIRRPIQEANDARAENASPVPTPFPDNPIKGRVDTATQVIQGMKGRPTLAVERPPRPDGTRPAALAIISARLTQVPPPPTATLHGKVVGTALSGRSEGVLDRLPLPRVDDPDVMSCDEVQEEWVARYNGPGDGADRASALAVDAAGNVYVTGHSWGAGTLGDYATVKYGADGNPLWEARYDGPGHGDDLAHALAVDAAGNLYVTGESAGAGTLQDYATLKYDAGGSLLWEARYTGPDPGTDRAHALAVDAAGNVYVTGAGIGPSGWVDYATVKYDADGSELWVAYYNGPNSDSDRATALAVDAAGNVYVTGESFGGSTNDDYATIKYAQPCG